jgi:hypothetical protein
MRHPTQHLLAVFVLCLSLPGFLEAQQPLRGSLPPGAKLYIAPMEWNLDRSVVAEIIKRGLPVQVVADRREAAFVMTSLYQYLGSRMISPGHYIQVEIVTADGGKRVWRAEVRDFALFFAQLRAHGRDRAAKAIVAKLRNDISRAATTP